MTHADFNTYDNIDREVIEISKDSLRLRLEKCLDYALAPTEARAYGGISLTLLAAAFLTETFHNVWFVPGETVRSTFLVGGIAAGAYAFFRLLKWVRSKGDYSPEAVVNSLIQKRIQPLALPAPSAPEQLPKKKAVDTPLGRNIKTSEQKQFNKTN